MKDFLPSFCKLAGLRHYSEGRGIRSAGLVLPRVHDFGGICLCVVRLRSVCALPPVGSFLLRCLPVSPRSLSLPDLSSLIPVRHWSWLGSREQSRTPQPQPSGVRCHLSVWLLRLKCSSAPPPSARHSPEHRVDCQSGPPSSKSPVDPTPPLPRHRQTRTSQIPPVQKEPHRSICRQCSVPPVLPALSPISFSSLRVCSSRVFASSIRRSLTLTSHHRPWTVPKTC